jgi:hypothetical protein
MLNPAQNLVLHTPVGHTDGEGVQSLTKRTLGITELRERFLYLGFEKRALILRAREFIKGWKPAREKTAKVVAQ